MLKMAADKWKDHNERSISELVTEDGAMRTNVILSIIQQLCLSMNKPDAGLPMLANEPLDPHSILLDRHGNVRWPSHERLSLTEKAYNPPELFRSDDRTPAAQVYALGMLMLYMATGNEKKSEASTHVNSRFLRNLIERCIAFDPSKRIRSPGELLEAIKHSRWALKPVLLTCGGMAATVLLLFLAVTFWQKGQLRGGISGEKAGYASGYADGYGQGFSDAPGIGIREGSFDFRNGNLRGNQVFEDGALAARSENAVFFLMGGKLYQMDPNTLEIHLLTEAAEASCLQYYDGWVYYCTEDKIVRFHPKTMRKESFCDSRSGLFYIYDDAFYLYDHSGTNYLYRIQQDNKVLTQLHGEMKYRSLNVAKNKLYYIDPDQHYSIWRCDLDGSNIGLISSHSYSSICLYDDEIYAGTENGLFRMDLNGGNPEVMTSLPAYHPNVSDGGIYYVAGKGKTLEWMSLDGKTRFTLVSSHTGEFNIVGQWIIYRNEDDGNRLWRVRISGSDAGRLVP